MFKKCLQLLKSRGCAVLFGIVLISACTVSAGAVVAESSGDGMALYNGVMLPELPEWDKAKYPYAFISQFLGADYGDADAFVCSLYLVSAPGVFTDDRVKYTESFSCAEWLFTDSQTIIDMLISAGLSDAVVGKWLFGGDRDVEVSSPHSELFQEPFWSSYDIFDVSGGTQLATSAPIPLDGMNVITWDGDTTGLDVFNDYYYIVAPYSSASEAVSVILRSDGVRAVATDFAIENDEWFSYTGNDAPYAVGSPEYGIAFVFMSEGDAYVYTPILAYPASSGGEIPPDEGSSADLDFSNTSMRVSGEQVEAYTADYDVSFFNLPVTVSSVDSCTYFLEYKLNGVYQGHIYMGSSSDSMLSENTQLAPLWVTFDGLSANTEYTAEFVLRYSYSDYLNSVATDVTQTVSFTTLSDGSISEGDKAIIDAINQSNKDHQNWLDNQMGGAVGGLDQDAENTQGFIDDLDKQENEYHADAVNKFNELSATFSGFDGSVSSGIALASTLFSRVWNSMGNYVIVYTFPLLLGLALVIIGRVSRVHLSGSGDRTKGKDES